MNKILILTLINILILLFNGCQRQEHQGQEYKIVVYYQNNSNIDTFYVYEKVYLDEGNLRLKSKNAHSLASGVRTFKYLK